MAFCIKVELVSDFGEWYWQEIGSNGNVLCWSKNFTTKYGAKKSAEAQAKQLGVEIKEICGK